VNDSTPGVIEVDFELTDEMAEALKRLWKATYAERAARTALDEAKRIHEAASASEQHADAELRRVARPPRSSGLLS
jgi:hypothetical protein